MRNYLQYHPQITKEYVSERKAFGQQIAEFQNTRFKMAKLQTQLK
ncbi:hypothetical protein EB151_05210, partial [archaeon]|nr:hypothetical protein [archaeon]